MLKALAYLLLVITTIALQCKAQNVQVRKSGIVDLYMTSTKNGMNVELVRDGVSKMKGTLGKGLDFTDTSNWTDHVMTIIDVDNGFRIEWLTTDLSFEVTACFDLQKGELNWYGGPQIYQQEWPIQKLNLSGDEPYVLRKDNNMAVMERYWLNSKGSFIFVDDHVPLYVDQNMVEAGKVCFIAKNTGPYIRRKRVFHHYYLVALDDPVSAHKFAINNFLGQAQRIPSEMMIREPIWTTWAKYKRDINEHNVRDFAYDIMNHGFKGQIEIDEKWETCFGSRIFMPKEFGNISSIVRDLKKRGFRVTLWAAPFVNPDCTDVIADGEANGYFVKNTNGDMTTVWWESTQARQIDFTKKAAREWYSQKLRRLMEDPGVDSFKFDAGETDYVAQPALYENEDPELVPNILSQRYIHTVAEFGDLIEARSAFRTQNYSFFLRMIDKDSVWGIDDGLQSMVTTLLQLNIVGYSFVLPDMIGGNGYRAQPTLELLIRWAQATVFMPSMQFSYLPWDFDNDEQLNGTQIITSMIALHEKHSEDIINAMKKTITQQVPTNAPIWWLDPTDEIALQTSDEFLLGETILVAPVMDEGAESRQVYLPKGIWLDGNDGSTVYQGPVRLNYAAPLSVLPYFIKQS